MQNLQVAASLHPGQYAFPLADLKPGWRRYSDELASLNGYLVSSHGYASGMRIRQGVPLLSSSGEMQDGNPALICRFELI